MNIGFLAGKRSFGGGERILETLITEMYVLGHAIYIYSWEEEWATEDKKLPYRVSILNHSPVGVLGKYNAFLALRQSLISDKPDCLVVFSTALAEVAVFSAKAAGVPILLSERVDPAFLPKVTIHRIMKKIVFSLADAIVFQTDHVKQYFSKAIQKKGVIIQNMLMDDNWPAKNNFETKKEIIAVGRLSEEKNFQMLIRAFAAAGLNGYKLKIFGEGPCCEELDTLISTLNMKGKVILEGKVEFMMQHMIGADIFVISSNHEGMPNALLEAMAAGLACISTDVNSSGSRALITHGVDGILIPVNNADALKNALLYLVNNPVIKDHMKEQALKIRERNNKKKIISLWIELIKTLGRSKV